MHQNTRRLSGTRARHNDGVLLRMATTGRTVALTIVALFIPAGLVSAQPTPTLNAEPATQAIVPRAPEVAASRISSFLGEASRRDSMVFRPKGMASRTSSGSSSAAKAQIKQ